MDREIIIAELNDRNPDALLFENLDSALIGPGCIHHREPVAVYSKAKIYEKLAADGFSPEDSDEYFSKLINKFAGYNTPVIIHDTVE